MAETYLQLSVGEVADFVETYIGGTVAAGVALKHVKAGYQRFLTAIDPRNGIAHLWSFLQPEATLTLWTSFAAGTNTVTSTGTTLTAASAIFHASMVGATITITGSGDYTIVSYTSSTVVVIDSDPTAVAATFSMTATGEYALPIDFGGLVSKPVYAYDADYSRPRFIEKTPETIYTYWRDTDTESTPFMYAVVPYSFTPATGQRWRLIVAPVPLDDEGDRDIKYRYHRLAVDITDDPAVYFLGGPLHSYTIRACALADAEIITGSTRGEKEALAQQALIQSIDRDKYAFSSHEIESMEYGYGRRTWR